MKILEVILSLSFLTSLSLFISNQSASKSGLPSKHIPNLTILTSSTHTSQPRKPFWLVSHLDYYNEAFFSGALLSPPHSLLLSIQQPQRFFFLTKLGYITSLFKSLPWFPITLWNKIQTSFHSPQILWDLHLPTSQNLSPPTFHLITLLEPLWSVP